LLSLGGVGERKKKIEPKDMKIKRV
jgi:hypothetical protein